MDKFAIRQPIFMMACLAPESRNSMFNLSNWRYFCDL